MGLNLKSYSESFQEDILLLRVPDGAFLLTAGSQGTKEYMTGRIVLSHVHVFTLRRTRSTEKLISTGLASGGIITLE